MLLSYKGRFSNIGPPTREIETLAEAEKRQNAPVDRSQCNCEPCRSLCTHSEMTGALREGEHI
jgi:hypothetical protein